MEHTPSDGRKPVSQACPRELGRLTIDRLRIPFAVLEQMLRDGSKLKPTGHGPLIADAFAYFKRRRPTIREQLLATASSPAACFDASEEYLSALPDGLHDFAVLSLDVVGSAAMSLALDARVNARIMSILLGELAAVAPLFHAHILKFTGDGVLAYFSPDSFLTANDNAIDAALTMRGLVREAVNPELAALGYPTLSVRIGIESGQAVAQTVGHPSSKQHRDLFGKAINMACKIQASGSAGEIRIGQIAYQNMHTKWKLGCEEVASPAGWRYMLGNGKPYPVYRYVADAAELRDAANVQPVQPAI